MSLSDTIIMTFWCKITVVLWPISIYEFYGVRSITPEKRTFIATRFWNSYDPKSNRVSPVRRTGAYYIIKCLIINIFFYNVIKRKRYSYSFKSNFFLSNLVKTHNYANNTPKYSEILEIFNNMQNKILNTESCHLKTNFYVTFRLIRFGEIDTQTHQLISPYY